MNRRQLILAAAAATTASTFAAGSAWAQGDAPLKILVGFPAGGSIDIATRVVADKMKDVLKRTVVVENRAGAGGRLAAGVLKSAPPDGNTVMVAPLVVPVLAPMVFSKLNYDVAKDFAPIGHVCSYQFAVAVSPTLPVHNVAELVKWLRAHPQQANFGSPAAGSLPHFFGAMMGQAAGVDMVHVPFAGGGALQSAIAGGQVPIGIDVVLELMEFHRSGRVRILATSGMQRSKALPDVPTFRESGYPDLVGEGWFAMYAPAGTPAAVVSTLNDALNKALVNPEVQERFAKLALEAGSGTPADLESRTVADVKRWAPVVKSTGFRGD